MKFNKKATNYVRRVLALALVMSLAVSMFPFAVGAAAGGKTITMVLEQTGDDTVELRVYAAYDFASAGFDFEIPYPVDDLDFISATVVGGTASNADSLFGVDAFEGVVAGDIGPSNIMLPLGDGLFLTVNFAFTSSVNIGDTISGFNFIVPDDMVGGGLTVVNTDATIVVEEPFQEADAVTIGIDFDTITIPGERELVLTVSHDGVGAQPFFFVVEYSLGTGAPARMVIPWNVTNANQEIRTRLMAAVGSQITVVAVSEGPFTGANIAAGSANRFGSATTNVQ